MVTTILLTAIIIILLFNSLIRNNRNSKNEIRYFLDKSTNEDRFKNIMRNNEILEKNFRSELNNSLYEVIQKVNLIDEKVNLINPKLAENLLSIDVLVNDNIKKAKMEIIENINFISETLINNHKDQFGKDILVQESMNDTVDKLLEIKNQIFSNHIDITESITETFKNINHLVKEVKSFENIIPYIINKQLNKYNILCENKIPKIINKSIPEIINESIPEIINESIPEIINESIPEIINESIPEIINESIPEPLETKEKTFIIFYIDGEKTNTLSILSIEMKKDYDKSFLVKIPSTEDFMIWYDNYYNNNFDGTDESFENLKLTNLK